MHKYNKMKGKFLAIHHSPLFDGVFHNSLIISDIRKSTYALLHKLILVTTYISVICGLQLGIAGCTDGAGWTAAERDIIGNPIPGTALSDPATSAPADSITSAIPAPDILRVLTVDDPADSLVLRVPCMDFSAGMLASPEYAALATLMVATVTDPSEDGVGIAGPQVGISRRIVAVQRFDKPGEPFEVYPNIRIVATRGDLCPGPEGCLSVPGRRGTVLRYRDIDIQYTLVSPSGVSSASGALRDTVERIQGFTAVIFQHECDHLDGVLYIDKLEPAL